MTQNFKKSLIVLALLALSGAVSWHFYFKDYLQADTVNIHQFPARIGDWVAEEIPISDRDYGILETRNAFTRMYKNSAGDEVMLLIVYSQTNRKAVHPPEICYTGDGTTFLTHQKYNIPIEPSGKGILFNKFLVEQGGAHKQVMCYCFKVGSTFTPNYLKGQVLIAVNRLLGKSASGALIRLSASYDPEDPSRAQQSIDNFTRLTIPYLKQYLP